MNEIFEMKEKDTLLLYTDCLKESNNSFKEEFGQDNILKALKKINNNYTAKVILDKIMEIFFNFVDNTPLKDDLTVIVLKRK